MVTDVCGDVCAVGWGGDGWCARRLRGLGWLGAAAVAGHPAHPVTGTLVARAITERIQERVDKELRPGLPLCVLRADLPDAFAAALDDDLGVPQALAVVHETVRAGNAALDAGDKDAAARALVESCRP